MNTTIQKPSRQPQCTNGLSCVAIHMLFGFFHFIQYESLKLLHYVNIRGDPWLDGCEQLWDPSILLLSRLGQLCFPRRKHVWSLQDDRWEIYPWDPRHLTPCPMVFRILCSLVASKHMGLGNMQTRWLKKPGSGSVHWSNGREAIQVYGNNTTANMILHRHGMVLVASGKAILEIINVLHIMFRRGQAWNTYLLRKWRI